MASDLPAAVPPPDAFPAPLRAPPSDARRSARRRAAVVGALGAVALALPHLVTLPGIPLCAFKLWTGRPCPGCGMTRSVFALAHGDLAASFVLHPLGPVVAAALLAVLGGALVGASTGRDPVWRFATRRAPEAALATIAALVALWVVRAVVVPSWGPDAVGAALPR